MKCLAMLACSALVLAACSDATAPAEVTSAVAAPSFSKTGAPASRSVSRDYSESDFLAQGPKIVNCTGEPVLITMRLESRIQIVTDANGGFHGTFTVVDKGSTGVGTETGTVYRDHEGQAETFNAGGTGFPQVSTSIFTRHLVSPGSAANVMVHNVAHFTINANGETSVDFATSDVTCTK